MWKCHIVISPLRVFLMMAVIIVKVFSACRRMLSVWVAQGQAMMGSLYLNYVSHDTVIQFVSLVTESTKCVKVGSCRFALIHSSSSMTDHAMCCPFYAREKLMGQPARGGSKEFLDWRIGWALYGNEKWCTSYWYISLNRAKLNFRVSPYVSWNNDGTYVRCNDVTD